MKSKPNLVPRQFIYTYVISILQLYANFKHLTNVNNCNGE